MMNLDLVKPSLNYDMPRSFLVQEISLSPRIVYLKDFLTPEECEHLVTEAKAKIRPSTIVDPETGEFTQIESRSSSGTFFHLRQTDIIANVEERISAFVGLPVENGEGLQVLNYQIGQEYRPHYDFFDPSLKGSQAALATGGQRVYTILMYLNHVEEGGETIFPSIGKSVRPKMGDALLFQNLLPNGDLDFNTLHGSDPVRVGEKWVSTKWVREREYK